MKNQLLKRTTKGLICLTLLSICFVLFRIYVKQESMYSFLLWNLFLAWIPFILSILITKFENIFLKFVLMGVWILFYPNSPYIITDLLHLKNYHQNIIWYDSLMIFTTASTALLIALHSLHYIKKEVEAYINRSIVWFILVFCNILTGFGIYLGRYCRLNSWDLFNRPMWLMGRIYHQFENPLCYKLTATFAVFLTMIYIIFENFFVIETKQ